MKKLLILAACTVALAVGGCKFTYAPSAYAADKVCTTATVAEFTQNVQEFFAKQGQTIEMVPMTGEALVKFLKAVNDERHANGAPEAEDFKAEDYDLILWSAFKTEDGKDVVGLAFFKNDCGVVNFVIDAQLFADLIAKAFGPDAK
jgi:hypothetical protein